MVTVYSKLLELALHVEVNVVVYCLFAHGYYFTAMNDIMQIVFNLPW